MDDKGRKLEKEKFSDAIWASPAYERDGTVMRLLVSSYYVVAFAKPRAKTFKPVFRLREQILGGLTYHLHAHSARPGFVSF
jgi:hypothetical protein